MPTYLMRSTLTDEATMIRVSVELGSRGSAHYETLPATPIDECIEGLQRS